MISGSKAPDFNAYGLLRAMHSHVSAPLRSVLNMCHWHIAPYPLFAYRGIISIYDQKLFDYMGLICFLFQTSFMESSAYEDLCVRALPNALVAVSD